MSWPNIHIFHANISVILCAKFLSNWATVKQVMGKQDFVSWWILEGCPILAAGFGWPMQIFTRPLVVVFTAGVHCCPWQAVSQWGHIGTVDGLVTWGAWQQARGLLVCKKINTLRPRQNGRHFPDDIFKCIFLNENA